MKQQNVKLFVSAIIPAAAATLASEASAALLAPGAVAQDFFTSLTERPELGGSIVASQLIPLTLRGTDGSLVHSLSIFNEVIRNSPDNTLSFSYRIVNNDNGMAHIIGLDRLDAKSYAGFNADVASIIDGGGQTSPNLAIRANDGQQITFDFDDAASRIAAGASSFEVLIKTDASNFDRAGSLELIAFTAASIEEGSDPIALGTASVNAFQPISFSATIPLPSAALVGIPAMIGVTLYTLRRQRRVSQASA